MSGHINTNMFNIDKSINKIIGGRTSFHNNTPKKIKQPSSFFDMPKKIANLQQLATGSVFFPFTQPTVQHPTSGRTIQGRMPSMENVMKNFGFPSMQPIKKDKKSKDGGELFWEKLKEKNIGVSDDFTLKDKKRIRKEFEKRPELIQQASGIRFVHEEGHSWYAPAYKSEQVKPIPGQEGVLLGTHLFTSKQKEESHDWGEQKNKLIGSQLGRIMSHELEHSKQHKELPDSDLQRQRLELIKNEEILQQQAPFIRKLPKEEKEVAAKELYLSQLTKEEKEAVEAEVAPRERDIEVPEEKKEEAFRQVMTDEESENKKIIMPDGKVVRYRVRRRGLPSAKQVHKVYKTIPDDTNIPIVFQSKKQYLKEYIENQEEKHNIDFPEEQEQEYINNELVDMRGITSRYTTKKNKYMEPRTVFFTDVNWTPNRFKQSAHHEFGHELWESNPNIRQDWGSVNKYNNPTYYGKTDSQEDFADSYMLYRAGQLKDGKRKDILKVIESDAVSQNLVIPENGQYHKWFSENKTPGFAGKPFEEDRESFIKGNKPIIETSFFYNEEDEEERKHNDEIDKLKQTYPTVERDYTIDTIGGGTETSRQIIFYKPGEKERAEELIKLNENISEHDKQFDFNFHTKKGILLGYTEEEIDAFNEKLRQRELANQKVI